MCRKATFYSVAGSLQDENGDCWSRQQEKEGQGSVLGEDSFLGSLQELYLSP